MNHQDSTPVNAPAAPVAPITKGSSTPRDFFLWFGAIIALYASITAILVLLFDYIDIAYPDALDTYSDPYSGAIRFSMATLIVMVPAAVILFRTIRRSISDDASKAGIRIRRWAIALTLFLAAAIVAIDLITVINMFLSGEITSRFILKAASVLLVAGAVFLHFLADSKGYWVANPSKANAVGGGFIAVALVTIVAGFMIAGTPTEMRQARLDQQRVESLRSIQYQLVEYWRMREELPESLTDLQDPIAGYTVETDPETGAPYKYEVTGPTSFTLCATFAAPARNVREDQYSRASLGWDSAFPHAAGRTCFERTIDPEAYPPYADMKAVR